MKTRLPLARFIGWTLACLVGLFAGGDGLAQKKNLVWNPVLPAPESRKLIDQAVAQLQEALAPPRPGTKETPRQFRVRMTKARCAALALAAYAQSSPGIARDRQLATLRDAALGVSRLLAQGNANSAGALAATLGKVKADPKARLGPVALGNVPTDAADLMHAFKLRFKGGDGIPPVLHTVAKLSGTGGNGMEEKIRYLAKKPLTPLQLKKEAAELTLLAYKTAALAQLAEDYSPRIPVRRGKQKRADWTAWAQHMRQDALNLAKAVGNGPEAVQTAAGKLNIVCNRCHGMFKP